MTDLEKERAKTLIDEREKLSETIKTNDLKIKSYRKIILEFQNEIDEINGKIKLSRACSLVDLINPTLIDLPVDLIGGISNMKRKEKLETLNGQIELANMKIKKLEAENKELKKQLEAVISEYKSIN